MAEARNEDQTTGEPNNGTRDDVGVGDVRDKDVRNGIGSSAGVNARLLAIFDPTVMRPEDVRAVDMPPASITAAHAGIGQLNDSLQTVVGKLGDITPAPAVIALQSSLALVALAPEQEPTAMTSIFQAMIPNALGLVDIDRDTVLAYGDDLVRYPMTTAQYTLGWSSPSGIKDVLAAIQRQQTDTAYSRTDYVKIIDRKPAYTAHAGNQQQTDDSTQEAAASAKTHSQWDTQHYIQSFYSATSGSVGTQGNIMAEEGFWIEVRNGAAELHFGIGGLDLPTATDVFRRWLDGERKFPDIGQWQKLII
ncbi:hypothetical protein QP888_06160 [Corynebacterium sp. MSK297]|uniref:hypothetical protein n=1 Tax=Corynebacterium sp. MSK297 TaxID=3050221 RepID=UPI00254A846F|nr:hypothetical protein [Corynebacterium sp. MSK297]MDK8846096.1 hypothetical protein [Corynebacterium sp. MSK297]